MLKPKLFYKLFGLMVFGFLIVFAIQLLGRTIFFERVYLNQTHNRNIAALNEATEYVNTGGDLYEYIFSNGLTNITAYVLDDEFEIILDDYFPFEVTTVDEEYEDYPENTDEFIESDGIYYQVFEGLTEVDDRYTLYYSGLDNGKTIVFEQYLYGLSDAQSAQNKIDLYVILVLIIFLIPYTYWYSKRFTKPLYVMNSQVKALSNLEFLPPLAIESNDEIGELARSINKVSADLESAINKLKDDIEFEKYRDKKRRELIVSLSHELKTPITTLRAVIEGMSDNIGKYQDRDVYLKESLDYLHFMEVLSNDLIDAISIESKIIKNSSNSLLEIYREATRFVNKAINTKSQTLTAHITDIKVECNKDMIMRVLINLLNNATKYSNKNEEIVVSNTVENDICTITVTNTGAHIDEAQIEHLFDPFFRLEKSRSKKTGGSGLGLFIIKTILEGHNSQYSIRNTENAIEFSFTLKVVQ